jgi:hypothetical protein
MIPAFSLAVVTSLQIHPSIVQLFGQHLPL